MVVIVGQKKAMAIAVKSKQLRRRWSKLREHMSVYGSGGVPECTSHCRQVVMQGLMMERPLLISGLLEHAAAVHGDREIVSYAAEELVHRGCYRTTAERVRCKSMDLI